MALVLWFPLKGSFKGDLGPYSYRGYVRQYWQYFGLSDLPWAPSRALSLFVGI